MEEKLTLALILKVRIWSAFCHPGWDVNNVLTQDTKGIASLVAEVEQGDTILCEKANNDVLKAIEAFKTAQ